MNGKIIGYFQNSLMAEKAETLIKKNVGKVLTSTEIIGGVDDYKLGSSTIYPILPILKYPGSIIPEPLQETSEQNGGFFSEQAAPLIGAYQASVSVIGDVKKLIAARDIMITNGGYSLKLDV